MAVQKRERSRGYPQFPLSETVQLLEKTQKALGGGPYSRDAVAEAIGHKPGSGTANSKVAAIVHYGFFERSSGGYRLTELGSRVLHPTDPTEASHALATAAVSPALFRELFDKFKGRPLPELLKNILSREFAITPKQSADVADIFKETLAYCGLIRNGIVAGSIESDIAGGAGLHEANSQQDDHDAIDLERNTTQDAPIPNRRDQKRTAPTSHDNQFAIPLKGRRIALLDIPRPVDQMDIDRIKSWLDLMADALMEDEEENNPASCD